MGRATKAQRTGQPGVDDLPSIFEQLGLSNYEARVLAAIMGLGSGTASQIAEVAGVQRSNVYPVLETLRGQNLVEHRSGKVARWACPGRDEAVRRLCTLRVQRLEAAAAQVEAQGQEALRVVATLAPEEGAAPLSYVHVVTSILQVSSIYHRSFNECDEVLVCNREPYPGEVGVFEPIMAALARGIRARALYRECELDESEDLRAVATVYARAGVESRVVDDLPLAMAVFDRRIVLTALPEPVPAGQGVTTLYVEHPQFAESCVGSFEYLWAAARPLVPPADTVEATSDVWASSDDDASALASEPA